MILRPHHDPLVRRLTHRLVPDSTRVISRMFVPGQEDFGSSQSRAMQVLDRIIALDEDEVKKALDDVYNRFVERHDDLTKEFENHAHRMASRVQPGLILTDDRWRLIGAVFTHEFAIESSALTNPSMVMHPDQEGVEEGSLRFVMSVRGIGEGHRSSIGFRSGIISEAGDIEIDLPGEHPTIGTHWEPMLHQNNFRGLLEEYDDMGENARFILSQLGDSFTLAELNDVLFRFMSDQDSFRNADITVHHFRMIAERNYCVTFSSEHDVSERILWPVSYAEWRGMEDARFVRFTNDDGSVTHYATYTAFDGVGISQQLLCTDDFLAFETHPLAGAAAKGKGMALFPRKIGGMYAAMSRADHESNSVAFSDHLDFWEASMTVQIPSQPWDLIQMGNAGSPIETEAGWLLVTHGVGPMRTYCLSAVLLDLDDPSHVIGSLNEPLISPQDDERDGYVPNVVYSCGSLLHGDHLVIPYGISDHSISFAISGVPELLTRLTT